ncbi:MAG: hypothetical protein AAB316_15225 [Bacteroidota bacterium]
MKRKITLELSTVVELDPTAAAVLDEAEEDIEIIYKLLFVHAPQLLHPTKIIAYTQTACRRCGCTDDDCSQCFEAQGEPCYWIEPELCSRCAAELAALNHTTEPKDFATRPTDDDDKSPGINKLP